MKNFLIATSAAMLLTTAAYADVAAQLNTASTHAGLAAKAGAVGGVQTHLHHVINCLVGPNGAGFDAGNANPCAKDGAGAIPDGSADQKVKLQAAVGIAQAGLSTTDLAVAQKAALDTQAAIDGAK